MAVTSSLWLDLMHREYLRLFVPGGGSAVKFILAENDQTFVPVAARLEAIVKQRTLQFVKIDAAATKLHMIQDVFFAVVKWSRLSEQLFRLDKWSLCRG